LRKQGFEWERQAPRPTDHSTMKKLLFLLVLPLLLVQEAAADDQLRNVQSQLKSEGFYYGDVNGQASTEMTAAIRRYQIRNGLEVTGALNAETLHALGVSGAGSASQPPATAQQPATAAQRKPATDEGDRAFLRQEEQKQAAPTRQDVTPPAGPRPPDPSVVPPPVAPASPESDFPTFYANTPYFNAPREVQQETLRRAQGILADRGFYRETVDGLPGPATEEALLSFQRNVRLPLTGRLDLQTLGELRLLPGRGLANPPLQPFYPNNAARDYPTRRVYRGIQVD
jgi:peptidoglycan hydrolase-like protein with peptidoglycan-binding domain